MDLIANTIKFWRLHLRYARDITASRTNHWIFDIFPFSHGHPKLYAAVSVSPSQSCFFFRGFPHLPIRPLQEGEGKWIRSWFLHSIHHSSFPELLCKLTIPTSIFCIITFSLKGPANQFGAPQPFGSPRQQFGGFPGFGGFGGNPAFGGGNAFNPAFGGGGAFGARPGGKWMIYQVFVSVEFLLFTFIK